MKNKLKVLLWLAGFSIFWKLNAQMKVTFLNQTWLRYTDNNPGSTLFDSEVPETFDIGLRRTRMQFFGPVAPRVFVYGQVGLNNLSFNGARKQGIFLHDATAEYVAVANKLSFGSGLTAWNGLARYAAPSIGTLLALDAPLYQQFSNDISDQFVRKFSIYAKGKLGKLDYRLIASKPMAIQKASAGVPDISQNANFSFLPAHFMYHGYLSYQFKDQENNQTPYQTGTYLGSKNVMNLGLGGVYQKDAMWYLSTDTMYTDLKLVNADFFLDRPLDENKKTALTLYAAVQYSNYGKNYIRNIGVMNPTTGNNYPMNLNGGGNAVPLIGTGMTYYTQIGFILPKNILKENGRLQPYAAFQCSKFQKYNDVFLATSNIGINWLIDGHKAKLSFDIQNRPVVFDDLQTGYSVQRKNMYVLQYQISI